MKNFKILLVVVLVSLLTASCWQYPVAPGTDEDPDIGQPTIPDPEVPPPTEIPLGFDYSLTRVVNLLVDVEFTNGNPYAGAVLELYLDNICANSNRNLFRVMRFRVDNDGKFRSLISVPMGVDTVYLCGLSNGLPTSIPVTVNKDLNEARVVYKEANAPGNASVDHDEFSGDNWRFYNNYYPNRSGWSTLMYEDSWPRFDDYDMNDLVVDYRVTEITNQDNSIVEMLFDFRFRATCAGFSNAFAIEIPVSSTKVNSVNYLQQGLFTGMVNQLGNGLEAGHPDKSVIVVTDNITEFIPQFINCVNGGPTLPAGELQIGVNFNEPIPKSTLGVAPYKPFLIPIPNDSNYQENRGMEIHLPNRAPTALANMSIFGTNDDDSSIADGRYYLSIDRRNWAMNIPDRMEVYPIPRVSITEAFNEFLPWARSGGLEKYDWYKNRPGYRNDENIFLGN